MLFDHPEKYTVVESEQSGIMQHDPFSWHVGPRKFETVSELEKGSRFIDRTVNGWFLSLTLPQRELFVETLFTLLQATEARTNSELAGNWLKNSAAVLKALAGLDPEVRRAALGTVRLLFRRAAADFPNTRNSASDGQI
jgi:hypothetical protein